MERCPRCRQPFDGDECLGCGLRPGARIGRRGFISLALGAAAAALVPLPAQESLFGLPLQWVDDIVPPDRLYFLDWGTYHVIRPRIVGVITNLAIEPPLVKP